MPLLCTRLPRQRPTPAPPPGPGDWMTPEDLLALLAPRDAAPRDAEVSARVADLRTVAAPGQPFPSPTRTAFAEE